MENLHQDFKEFLNLFDFHRVEDLSLAREPNGAIYLNDCGGFRS